jgi:hypothetical protein
VNLQLNHRQGDFVAYQWLFDMRTGGEYSRLQSVTDCGCNTPPGGSPSNPINPYQNPPALGNQNDTHGNTVTWSGDNFQAQGTIKYVPCAPCVIACSPNAETFHNGVTIPFPSTFNFDARYGARWQLEFEQAMIDLLWQGPHNPCGNSLGWSEDDGTCQADSDTKKFYPHRPYVEARTTLPSGAPALPGGITLGQLNPVTNSGGLGAPGTPTSWLGYDINTGNPNGAWTWWGYRYTIESTSCPPASCRFNYVDTENLPCVKSATSTPAMVQPPPLSGLGGLT